MTPSSGPVERTWTWVGAVAGLGAAAVAHPVLSTVRGEPQYLVAHGLGPWEVVAFPVAVLVVATIPAVAVAAVAPVSRRVARGVAAVSAGVMVMLMLLHVGVRAGWPGWVVVAGAAAGAVGAGVVYHREAGVRRSGRLLVVLLPIVAGWFWVGLPPALVGLGPTTAALEVSEPYDVVVVVADEFSLDSLMRPDGELAADGFPGFARLAADGVWYRNAVTVETRTSEAVPAILTGSVVADGVPPVASAHPDTLMALLSGSHQVETIEAITDLCPEEVCPDAGQPLMGRWQALAADTGVVLGHLIAPDPLAAALPPIDAAWAGFGEDEADQDGGEETDFDVDERLAVARRADRRQEVEAFLAQVAPDGPRPRLVVGHFLLPHRPWVFLPDGTTYEVEAPPGYVSKGWGPDPFFVAEGWRRHLLQAGYVDSMVSEMIHRLEEAGRYDRTLLIVLADHGVAFLPGLPDMRATNATTAPSIMPVPLFVKYPADLEGAPEPGTIVDTRVVSIDVAPTVLEVVGADVPDQVADRWEGRSLLHLDGRPATTTRDLRGEPFEFGAGFETSVANAARRAEWFPAGLWSLVPHPSLAGLPGASTTELMLMEDPGLEVSLTREGAAVSGTVAGGGAGPLAVAIVAGDHITSITQTWLSGEDDEARFATLVPSSDLEAPGEMTAWVVDPDDPTVLRR